MTYCARATPEDAHMDTEHMKDSKDAQMTEHSALLWEKFTQQGSIEQ